MTEGWPVTGFACRWMLLATCLLAAGTAHGAPSACPAVAEDAATDITDLQRLSAVLKPGGTLEVLAIGSAMQSGPSGTTTPPTARKPANTPPMGAPETGFPWQAAHALEASVRGLHVNVTILGRRGLSAADMLPLLRLELARKKYRLVLWQTGTVEAVAGASPESFYQALADGAAAVSQAGAYTILIDPQYSRFLSANANLQPYLAALQAAGTLPGVGLFHRFELMHDWVEANAIDLEHTPMANRQAVAIRLHACLGRELAREILAALSEG